MPGCILAITVVTFKQKQLSENNMPNLELQQLSASALEDLMELYRYLHERDDPPPDRNILANTWQKIQSNPDITYLGGYINDILVSTCNISVLPNLTRGCQSYAVIENVVTHPQYRKQGFGKAVLIHALRHAWQHNCYKVMLMTGRKDEATLRFYESAGFSRDEKQAFIARPDHQ
jgi:GNAT superfamily N-acetyltransferase